MIQLGMPHGRVGAEPDSEASLFRYRRLVVWRNCAAFTQTPVQRIGLPAYPSWMSAKCCKQRAYFPGSALAWVNMWCVLRPSRESAIACSTVSYSPLVDPSVMHFSQYHEPR